MANDIDIQDIINDKSGSDSNCWGTAGRVTGVPSAEELLEGVDPSGGCFGKPAAGGLDLGTLSTDMAGGLPDFQAALASFWT